MRAAILLLFVAMILSSRARGDEPFAAVDLDSRPGYIVPEAYADSHKADLIASLPGPAKVTGFWTPTESSVVSSERLLHEFLESAAKDPSLLFPDLAKNTDAKSVAELEKEKNELILILQNYESYQRQYVGLIIDGNEIVFCNYADAQKIDPSTEYMFLEKIFATDGSIHFLQARVDPIAKTCSDVALIGTWQK
jgi:hypothetical protein